MDETEDLQLKDNVQLAISGEQGQVIGIAQYTEDAARYQVHYKDAHGAARTDWFLGSQLIKA